MLPEIHEALRALLYEQGRISPLEVDIRFETPARHWIERLTRPTINLFLFDVKENTDLRQPTYQTTRGNGSAERRLAPRRIDLHYMVSALTTDIDDEHRLLWRALVVLMRNPELPDAFLPEDLRGLDPPLAARVAQRDDEARLIDIWSALEASPRPSLHYRLTAPLDLDLAVRVPLVLTRTARYRRVHDAAAPVEAGIHIGGTVRDAEGQPIAGASVALQGSAAEPCLTDARGWFVLRGLPEGTVALDVTRPDGSRTTVTVTVPSPSYDIVLD